MMPPNPIARFTLFLLLTAFGLQLHSKELDGVRAPASNACPTVEEARAKMTVPEGYEVRAFAAEPDVVNPVAMDFDARGRLWVAELYEYPSGSKTPSPFAQKVPDQNYRPVPPPAGELPRDRIVILEDTNNDGRADKRTVFLEGLNLASGLCVADGGVYVGQSPHLLHFRDTDGDDHADQWKVVLTGFGRQDTHELLNSFQIGPDGALFFTQGVFTTSQVRRPQDPETAAHKMDTGLGRVVIDRSQLAAEGPFGTFELFADGLSNCWGFDYDAAGNFFAEACVIDHLFHVAPGGVYQRQAGSPGNPYAYELLPSIVDYKHFRSAYAGLAVYQGGVYPADTDGHIFLGNIHANAIHEERVEPRGASFKAFPVRDFLKGNDGWFRPVQIRTGPDGFLWVMDWCDKYPCYQNAVANPEGVDRQRGRIWRVCHTGTEAGKKLSGQSRTTKDLDFAKASSETLLNSLADNNNWVRRIARRLLVERMAEQPGKLIETLQAKVLESKNASERHEALWTLAGAGTTPWKDEFFIAATKHEDPVVRGWAARSDVTLTEMDFQRRAEIWKNLLENSETWVSSQLVAGFLNSGTLLQLWKKGYQESSEAHRYGLRGIVSSAFDTENSEDRLISLQLWKALEPVVVQSGGAWFHDSFGSVAPLVLTRKAARRVADMGADHLPNLFRTFEDFMHESPEHLQVTLEGLAQSDLRLTPEQAERHKPFLGYLASHPNQVGEAAQKLSIKWLALDSGKAVELIRNQKTPTAQRVSSLKTLAEKNPDVAAVLMPEILKVGGTKDWMSEVVSVASQFNHETTLLRLLDTFDPQVKTQALAVFAQSYESAEFFVNVVGERKGFIPKETKLTLNDLPPTLRRQLLNALHPSKLPPSFRTKEQAEDFYAEAKKLLGTVTDTPEELRKLITTKRSVVLTGTPDLAKGKQTFEAMCAVCHEFQGVGKKVGPDLNGSGRANLDNLLHNLIAPNEVIGSGYENWRLTTKDGRTAMGRIVEKTDRHIRLLSAGGIEETIAAEQVAKLENTGESLMPTGFGQLPDETLRDLVWYLLAPPAEGPLTLEKKAKLAESTE